MDTDQWELMLDRYCAGECSAIEAQGVRLWIGDDPERQALVDRLSADRMRRRGRPSSVDVEGATRRLQRQLAAPASSGRPVPLSARPSKKLWWPGVVIQVAVILLAAVAGGAALRVAGGPNKAQTFREFATNPGSRATITLHDGTRLVLGPASQMLVPRDFGRRSREVMLTGEALFTVVHNEAQPFVVRTAHAVTRDVGTTFGISAYAHDGNEQVVVAEGRVSVGGHLLGQNDMADIDSTGQLHIRRGVNSAVYVAWAQGELAFDGAPLSQAVRTLERTFNLEITIADSTLLTRHVTGTFGSDADANAVLDAITRVVGAHYVRTGRHVVIRQRGLNAAQPGRRALPAAQQTVSALQGRN